MFDSTMMMDALEYQLRIARRRGFGHRRLAATLAQWAHDEAFSSRRGVVDLSDGLAVVYNNHPYANCPTRREHELTELRARMTAQGFEELASASYPLDGEDANYTAVLLVRTPAGSCEVELSELYDEATCAVDRWHESSDGR